MQENGSAGTRHPAMPPELLELVAARFQALGEPARLQILNALRLGEKSVTELVEATGLRQANLSKHLQFLYGRGFVERRKDGLHVYYRIADEAVFHLCDVVCRGLEERADRQRRLLAALRR
jgi:ArsR family transcriptional regulator